MFLSLTETASFKVFDVGGNTVRIMKEGTEICSAPYAVTPSADAIRVVNETDHVHVWPMGWKQGNSGSGQPIPWTPQGGVEQDYFDFTVREPTDGQTNTGLGFVPYRGPYPNPNVDPDEATFTRARALNWQSTGDPKIVIRQDDRGGAGRDH